MEKQGKPPSPARALCLGRSAPKRPILHPRFPTHKKAPALAGAFHILECNVYQLAGVLPVFAGADAGVPPPR